MRKQSTVADLHAKNQGKNAKRENTKVVLNADLILPPLGAKGAKSRGAGKAKPNFSDYATVKTSGTRPKKTAPAAPGK